MQEPTTARLQQPLGADYREGLVIKFASANWKVCTSLCLTKWIRFLSGDNAN